MFNEVAIVYVMVEKRYVIPIVIMLCFLYEVVKKKYKYEEDSI